MKKENELISQALWNTCADDDGSIITEIFINPSFTIYDLTKKQVKYIKDTILDCDKLILTKEYKKHQNQYFNCDRKVLKELVNNWCDVFRCGSLYIEK